MVSRSGYLIAVAMVLLTMIIVGCVTAQDIPDVEATVVVMLEEEKEKSLPTPLSTEARLDEIKAKTFATPTPLPQPTASNEPLKTIIDSKEVIQIPTVTPTPRPGAPPQNPLLPSTPTPIPPTFTPMPPTEIVSDLQPMKCSDIERMKSDSSIQQEVDLEFRMLDNTGNYPLEIFWKDFQGKEVEYGSVGPGSSFNISTYTEHLWVLRRTNGDCVTGFIVEKSDISRNPEGLSAIINNVSTLEQTLNLATPTPIPTLRLTPTPRSIPTPEPVSVLTYVEMKKDDVGGINGLGQAKGVTVSPDGKHLYATGDDAVVMFSRNSSTGALTYIEFKKDNYNGIDGIEKPHSITVSPDGNHVYVAGEGDDAIAVFSRNSLTGDLTYVEMKKDGVLGVDGLEGAKSVTVSPDGNHVYATGWAENALAVFSRNSSNGVLTYVEMKKNGAGGVDGLDGVKSVIVSPDGNHVYTAAENQSTVAVFSRNLSTGALTYVEMKKNGVGGVTGLDGAQSVTVSPDGNHVYATSDNDDAISAFSRNSSTGALTYVEMKKDGVAGVNGLDNPLSITLSPYGNRVYVAGEGDDAIAVFSRNSSTGELTYVEMKKNGVGGVDGLNGVKSVIVSPDGKHVYSAGRGDNAVAVFSINSSTPAPTSTLTPTPIPPTPTPTTLKVFSHPDEVIKALDKHNIINCQTRATNTEGNIRRGGIEQEYLAFWGVHNDEYVEVSIPTLVCALESERDTLIATYGAKIRGPWIQISTFDDIEQADIYKNSGYKIEDSFFHSNVLIDISAVTFDETSYSETVYFSVDSIVEDLKDGSDRAAEEVNFKRTFLNTDEVIQALDKHPVRISYGEYDCYDNYDGGLWDSWDDENPFETLLNHATQTVDCRLDLSEAQQTALGTYSYGGQMRPHSGLYQRIQISIYYDESQMDLYRNTCQNDGNCLDVTTYFHDNAMIKIYSNDPTNKVITFPMPSILEDLLDGAAPAIAAPAAAVPYTQQEGFELVEYELKTDVWGYKKLFGVVENNTNYTQTEVSIQFAIYDANGSKVEDVLVEKYNFFVSGSTDSIAPGEKWEFEKYPLYPEKAETVEVVVLSGVPK